VFVDVSRSGTMVFARDVRGTRQHSLVWIDRDGQTTPLARDRHAYEGLRLAPNGDKIAVHYEERLFTNVWIYNLTDERWQQLTTGADNLLPVWSPSGDRVVFASNREGPFNLYMAKANGEGQATRLTHSANWQAPFSWSPDGHVLAYQENSPTSGWNIWILSLDDRTTHLWVPQGEGSRMTSPAFSPNGRWIAYQSRESSDQMQIYVRPFPGPGEKRRVSGRNGGVAPVWSRDGREILYVEGARIMSVALGPESQRDIGPARLAFAMPFAWLQSYSLDQTQLFDVSTDGRRVVAIQPDEAAPATPLLPRDSARWIRPPRIGHPHPLFEFDDRDVKYEPVASPLERLDEARALRESRRALPDLDVKSGFESATGTDDLYTIRLARWTRGSALVNSARVLPSTLSPS
jgi:Tol biopolymer transport system component